MAKKYDKVLHKRFRPLYTAAFFQGFVLWYALEKLFMKSIGLNDETIAIATIVFTVIMLVINIPMGILADRWSRKGVLMIASIALILCSFIGGISHGFWMYTLAASFWGIYYASYVGTYDSIVYDGLLEEKGTAAEFEYYYGKVQVYHGTSLVVGSLLSSVIAHFMGLRAAYFLTIPFAGISLVSLYFFKEPKEHKKEVSQLVGAHIKSTFRAIMHKGEVLWIVLTLVFLTIGMRIMFEFDQLWLIALALPVVFFGPVNALILTSLSSGGYIGGKLKSREIILGGILLATLSTVLLTRHRILIIAAQTVMLTGFVAFNVIFNRYLHDTLPSNIRVGASSIVTTIGYIAFLPIGYIFGFISKYWGIFNAAWIVVLLTVATVICSVGLINLRSKVRRLEDSTVLD